MVLSKRERYIAIGAFATVGLLLVNYVVLAPLYERLETLKTDKATANSKYGDAVNVVKRSREDAPRWAEINRNGLSSDGSRTESQIYSAISSWARESGLNLTSTQKADRTELEQNEFNKITIRAVANGGMTQIARFLWHVQTANIPVKINDLTITSRKEGTDDLAMQISLATIFFTPEKPKTDNQTSVSASSAQEGRR